jgi:hypothetical protein
LFELSKTFQFDWDVMINHMNDVHGIKIFADNMKSNLKTALDERKEMTPKSGYTVVEFDDFAPPGENLTCINHFETRDDAEKFAKEKDSKELPVYVYGPKKLLKNLN